VASTIAEANAAKALNGSSSPPALPSAARTPILPLSIVSTSFPGIALMDYKKKGDEELDLVKDDSLRVFKRYHHRSYVVKEEGGDRGWVPVNHSIMSRNNGVWLTLCPVMVHRQSGKCNGRNTPNAKHNTSTKRSRIIFDDCRKSH